MRSQDNPRPGAIRLLVARPSQPRRIFTFLFGELADETGEPCGNGERKIPKCLLRVRRCHKAINAYVVIEIIRKWYVYVLSSKNVSLLVTGLKGPFE